MAIDDGSSDTDFDGELDRHGLRPDDPGTPGLTRGRVLALIGVALIAGFWIWAFSPLAPNTHPDELDSSAFADAARPLCAAAAEALEALPTARETTSMTERADLIDRGTVIYRRMLNELETVAPAPTTDDGDVVARWLADYRVYLADRDAYAADFRAGIDGAFVVSTKGVDQITDPINAFTSANRMVDCVTPSDV